MISYSKLKSLYPNALISRVIWNYVSSKKHVKKDNVIAEFIDAGYPKSDLIGKYSAFEGMFTNYNVSSKYIKTIAQLTPGDPQPGLTINNDDYLETNIIPGHSNGQLPII